MTAQDLKNELDKRANKTAAKFAEHFFKTYDGGYGEGDQFLGLKVPVVREVCKQFNELPLPEIETLLDSPIHEHRQAGLMILTNRAHKANRGLRRELYDFFMAHIRSVNNWDLVDGNTPTLVGEYLLDKPRDILYQLAVSKDLWERRIAIIATQAFIRAGQLDDTLAIATILLHDKHDLIHKAVGWMLRSAGDRDQTKLISFLDNHAYDMPRTMLRYAIEHFSPESRQKYLQAKAAKSLA